MNVVRSFVNYAIFRELRDHMRFDVDCAKSHHRVISEGLQGASMIMAVMRAASSRKIGLKHFQPAVSMLFFVDIGCWLMRSK